MNDSFERMLIARAYQEKMPLSGSLELTPLCTMDCNMCYVKLSKKEQMEQGKIHDADEWLTLADQMKEAGTLFVLLTGGEPLLHPQFKEIYLGLKERGMIVTINTNGTLIDETWADFFAENPPRRINISLYGGTKETYERLCHYKKGLEQTIWAIRLLKERNLQVKMNGSLVKDNAEELEDIVKIAKELDVVINVDTYMYPVKNSVKEQEVRLSPEEAAVAKIRFQKLTMEKEAFAKLKEETLEEAERKELDDLILKMRCQAGSSSFAISWKGEMSPCVMLKEMGKVPVFTCGFTSAWEKIVTLTKQIRLNEDCATCKLQGVCPTCAASALHEEGDCKKRPEYLCRYTKAYCEEMRNEFV